MTHGNFTSLRNFGGGTGDYFLRELVPGPDKGPQPRRHTVLYSEPITGLLYSGTTRVAAEGRAPLSLQAQQAAADRAAPEGAALFRVVTPKEPDRVSEFTTRPDLVQCRISSTCPRT